MKREHILIIRFSAMGDVAMIVPVVHSLATQYPDVRITVLSRPFARPLFENLWPNVSFMEADIKKEYSDIKGLNALYRRLVAKNFTAIADFHSILRSHYLRMRFNIDRYKVAHIDKHRTGKRRLIANINKVLVQQPTSFQNYADVLAKLGYPVNLDFTSLFIDKNGRTTAQLPEIIGTKKPSQSWIGIAPFATHTSKIYPIWQMEEVIRIIIDRHPSCRIFLFGGGEKEKKVFNEWAAKYPKCTSISGMFDGLHDELSVMKYLDVMISMDSANMHLASLVAVPVVSVWGATHPFAGFMGWHQSIENAVQLDMPCRPCSIYGNKPCIRGDYACMNNIAPETIANKVEKILLEK